MKKLINLVTSRLFWMCLAFLVQFAVIFFSLYYFENLQDLPVAFRIIGFIVAVAVFSRNDSPEYKLSWIMFIMLVPVFGCAMYLLFGNKKSSRKEARRMKAYSEKMAEHSIDSYPECVRDLSGVLSPEDARLSSYVSGLSESRVFGKTSCRYFSLGEKCFPAMVEELEKAQSFIFMEYFIYEKGVFWDTILEILRRKASEGVDVRVMYDDMGSINTLPIGYYRELRSYGIKCIAFNPIHFSLNHKLNYRDHRKVTIIDGNVAVSGGINIADEYINNRIKFGQWKDNGFILKGEGVWDYTYMFLQLWQFAGPREYQDSDFSRFMPTRSAMDDGFVQSFGDSPLDYHNVAENAYMQVINSANDYVWIATPYLLLDNAMINALTMAARSGVDVRIVTPAVPDKKLVYALTKANYGNLLNNGVRVFEYVPGFIHSKMFVSDDKRSIVGTTNMDFRSFYLHFESGTIFYGGTVVKSVREDFEDIFDLSREVQLKDFQSRSWFMKLSALLTRIIAPLL